MRPKSILIVLMLATFAFNAQAQFRVAAKGGGNLSAIPMTLNGVELDIYNPRFGFHGGLMAEYMFSHRFGISSGLAYYNSGATIDPDKYLQGSDLPEGFSLEGYVSMHTLQLPLFAKIMFDLPGRLQYYFMAGGFASYAFKAEQHVKQTLDGESLKVKWSLFEPEIRVMGETEDNVYMQQRFNAGISLETGVEINRQATVGVGFRRVLNNMAAFGYQMNGQSVKPDIRMWTVSLTLGYYL